MRNLPYKEEIKELKKEKEGLNQINAMIYREWISDKEGDRARTFVTAFFAIISFVEALIILL